MDPNKVEYPCPEHNNELTTIVECVTCDKCLGCDVYATMLDEVYDMK